VISNDKYGKIGVASHLPESPKVRLYGGQVRKHWDPSAGGLARLFYECGSKNK
jgi:hypothetical protein